MMYADNYEGKGLNNSRRYEGNSLVYEAYIPILLCGLTEQDVEYWKQRVIESYDKMVEGFNRTFLNGVDKETGEQIGCFECYKKHLVRKSVNNFVEFINEEKYDRVFIKSEMLFMLLSACQDYLNGISKVKDKDWYLNRVEEGYQKMLSNRTKISGLMGSRRGFLDAGFIATGLITGQRYVLKFLRPFDVLIPNKWVKNIFREKWILARHRLYRIFNKLSTLLHFMVEEKITLNDVNQVLENHIEKEIKPLIWIEKYELNELKILEDENFKAGKIYVKITQKM